MRKTLPLQTQGSPDDLLLLPAPTRRLRVALVNMPWARVDAPSIQCGLLQSIATQVGHDCDVHYLNLELAAILGHRMYDQIAERGDERLYQLGEWLFSYAAFGQVRPEKDYFDEFPEIESVWSELTGKDLDHLITFRRKFLPGWLDDCIERIDWRSYDVVGFSSTFLQNSAAISFGRKLRDRFPALLLVYGGANFDGEMGVEYARHLYWLDFVVTGEADIAFPTLLNQIATGTNYPIPGVHRQGTDDSVGEAKRMRDLDNLPVPDYHDYFQSLQRLDPARVLGEAPVKLPVEFSRGCWWGEKHHCTFCGLNALGMSFRPKSEQRALDELEALLRAYPAVHVDAVDNILDMSYLTSVCAVLAERRWDMSIFFEVKANLTREQLSTIQRAGINSIQPGIESLSSHVLSLMRKGSTKLINIRLLKWARYYGISVQWNILNGFPGETDEDYIQQAELIPLLYHLQPPEGGGRIWLERFSPYFTESAFPLSNVQPKSIYRHIYPSQLDYSKIAYFFDYEAADVASEQAYDTLRAATLAWRQKWANGKPPSLIYQRLPGKVSIIDRRSDQPQRAILKGWRGEVYEACTDTARSAKRIYQQLLESGVDPSLERLTSFLNQCCRSGVMVSDDGKFLALALPENPGW